jgi:hypothetical protein
MNVKIALFANQQIFVLGKCGVIGSATSATTSGKLGYHPQLVIAKMNNLPVYL